MSAKEQFGSRWGLVLATLGMAVGTGNIWRFPRLVARVDGGQALVSGAHRFLVAEVMGAAKMYSADSWAPESKSARRSAASPQASVSISAAASSASG